MEVIAVSCPEIFASAIWYKFHVDEATASRKWLLPLFYQ